MNNLMQEAIGTLMETIGQDKIMIAATRNEDNVAARTINIYNYNHDFYFVTECTSNKYQQLKTNACIALAVDAIQINGNAELLEHPSHISNKAFVSTIEAVLPNQFDKYRNVSDMRLIKIKPYKSSYILLETGRGYVIDYQAEQCFEIAHEM